MEPEERAENGGAVALLQEAFRWMDKALRSLVIYDRDHQVARSFQTSTGQHFVAATDQEGETWLEVRAKSLLCGETEVYREEPESDGFLFRMHRDGIRRLCLLPGLDLEEMERFTRVLQTELDRPEHFDDDMVTLLWDADLEHVKLIVADLLTQTPDQGEDLRPYQELMDRIIAAATDADLPPGDQRRDPERIRMAVQAFGDLDPQQVAATLAAADEGGARAVGQEPEWADLRARYDDPHTLDKFVEILHRGVALAPAHADTALSAFDLLVEALLRSGRHPDLLASLRLVDRLGEGLQGTAVAAGRLQECLPRAGRPGRLVSDLEQPETDAAAVFDLLRRVPPRCCVEILQAGARLGQGVASELARVLAELASASPELLSPMLASPEPAEVRLAVEVLLGIGSEEALDCLRPLRQSASPDMRIWLLRLTQDLRSAAVASLRRAMLDDPHPRVRAEAERCLARQADPELVKRLFRRLVDGSLKEQSAAEKRRVCTMLGHLGGPREIRLLGELVHRGRVLSGRRQLELCVAAVHGLAATGDRAHLDLLEQTAARRLMARQVKDACREAAALLRSGRRPRASSQVQPVPELPPPAKQPGAADPPQETAGADPPAGAPAPPNAVGSLGGTEDYGFVDLASEEPAATGDGDVAEPSGRHVGQEEPAVAGGGDMAELLRGYVDAEEPEASRASSSAEGGGGLEALLRDYLDQEAVPEARTGDDDAVDDLLRRYMDDDEEEATAAPAGGDDELAELLRSYVDEEDPR